MRLPVVVLGALVGAVVGLEGLVGAQIGAPAADGVAWMPARTATHRVFLKDGQGLPSFGDAARVGDRIIFNLAIPGGDGDAALELVSLPVSAVDVDRTARYAEAMRAHYYAATRGEAEYTAMTAEVTRELAALSALDDRKRQLVLAEAARWRLQQWPRDHFYYRAREVDELSNLFADVINELRAAAGETSFSLDLTAGSVEPSYEALLAPPGRAEGVVLALAAAEAADIGEERVAILRAAVRVGAGDPALNRRVSRQLEVELRAGAAYDTLAGEFRQRADVALRAGNVRTLEDLPPELLKRDRQLGYRRPQQVQALVDELQVALEAARAHRSALDRYAAVYQSLLGYERRIRPALSGLDGLSPVLRQIRDLQSPAFEQTVSAETRFQSLLDLGERIEPPADLAGIHSTVLSALRMAREACVRRRQAAVTDRAAAAREASAAAAGALLLADQARADLVAALSRPRVP